MIVVASCSNLICCDDCGELSAAIVMFLFLAAYLKLFLEMVQEMVLEAFVVAIAAPAAHGNEGLLQVLLQGCQAGRFDENVMGLPAVQVRLHSSVRVRDGAACCPGQTAFMSACM
jgi:hypothetical protein